MVIREDNEEVRVIYKELSHEPAIMWDRSFDGQDGWIVPTEINGKLFRGLEDFVVGELEKVSELI